MNKILISIVVLILIGFGVYYFISNNKQSAGPVNIPPVSNTQSSTNIGVVNSAPITINIKNFTFSPNTISIKKGTNVVWINNDSAPHTITSDLGDFDSGTIAPGGSFNRTFNSLGTINYHCDIHKTMKGSIVIE